MRIFYFPLWRCELSDNVRFLWSGAGVAVDDGAKFSLLKVLLYAFSSESSGEGDLNKIIPARKRFWKIFYHVVLILFE